MLRSSAQPQEIMAYCRSKLHPDKQPRQIFIVDALPRNANGKLVKRELVERLRVRKHPSEVAAIRRAAALAAEALAATLPGIRPGQSELQVSAVLEAELRRRGSEWHPFPTIVASGPRAALPHAASSMNNAAPSTATRIGFTRAPYRSSADVSCIRQAGSTGPVICARSAVLSRRSVSTLDTPGLSVARMGIAFSGGIDRHGHALDPCNRPRTLRRSRFIGTG